MLYHGSTTGGIKILTPRKSKYGNVVFMSAERNRCLVYLSNPIQAYLDKKYGKNAPKTKTKWAVYSIDSEGVVTLKEHYPNMIKDTFKGKSGYIYEINESDTDVREIPLMTGSVYYTKKPIKPIDYIYIADVYQEIKKLVRAGQIKIQTYEQNSQEQKMALDNWVQIQYITTKDEPFKEFLIDHYDSVRKLNDIYSQNVKS